MVYIKLNLYVSLDTKISYYIYYKFIHFNNHNKTWFDWSFANISVTNTADNIKHNQT